MNSKLFLAVVIVMLTVWDSTLGSDSGYQTRAVTNVTRYPVRCDQIHKEAGDPADFIRISSFTVIYTIGEMFKCAKAVYVRPLTPDLAFTIIVTRGNSVITYDTKAINCGKTGELTDCGTGMMANWQVHRVRLEFDSNGYFCTFMCNDDGAAMKEYVCLSAGNSRNPEIETAVEYVKENVQGADAIFDATANCPAPKCTFFP